MAMEAAVPAAQEVASSANYITVGLTGGTVFYILKEAFSFFKGLLKPKQKVEVENDPLKVETTKTDKFVTRGECNNYRCQIQGQLGRIDEGLKDISHKLDENDKRSEQRAINMNQRVDPLISALGKMQGSVDLIKESYLQERNPRHA